MEMEHYFLRSYTHCTCDAESIAQLFSYDINIDFQLIFTDNIIIHYKTSLKAFESFMNTVNGTEFFNEHRFFKFPLQNVILFQRKIKFVKAVR